MPSQEMRGRYLMREYWRDRALFTELDASEREVYLGLWQFADDAGWLRWEPADIGLALFGWESPESREARLESTVDKLVRLGKAKLMKCGHLYLPTVAKYPRAGGRKENVLDEHKKDSTGRRLKSTSVDSARLPHPTLPNPTTTSPQPPRALARTRGGAAETPSEILARLGAPAPLKAGH